MQVVDALVRNIVIGGVAAPAAVNAGDAPVALSGLKAAIAREVKARLIPRDAAAAHLGITPRSLTRWSHEERDCTIPRRQVLTGLVFNTLRSRHPEPVSIQQLSEALEERGYRVPRQELEQLMTVFVRLGRVSEPRAGSYVVDARFTISERPDRVELRAAAIYRRIQSIPHLIRAYVRGDEGANASIVRMNIAPSRIPIVAAKVRAAIEAIYREEMERPANGETLVPMTLFFLSARGWLGETE